MIFSAASLLLAAAGGYFSFSVFPDIARGAGLRSPGIIQFAAGRLVEASAYAPFCSILVTVACSLAGIILIYYFFENTQSPEILFFGLFINSFSFEFIRILLPLKQVFPFPSMYLITSFRVLFFGRNLGLFSLFAAGVYAAGMDMQKQQNVFLMLALASLFISLSIPIDILVWDSAFVLLNGYYAMFRIAEAGILLITITTFFVSAYTRSSRNYIIIGIGALLALVGRNVLFSSDNWITPLFGIFLLGVGMWLVCTRLHREYLWL